MDKLKLNQGDLNALAQSEIDDATPERLEWGTLCSNSLIRKENIDEVLILFKGLSEMEMQKRIQIIYWEAAVYHKYTDIVAERTINLAKSIDINDWIKRELERIDLLLYKGLNDFTCRSIVFHCPKKVPSDYECFLDGSWSDFFCYTELLAYKQNQFKSLVNSFVKQMWKDKQGVHESDNNIIPEEEKYKAVEEVKMHAVCAGTKAQYDKLASLAFKTGTKHGRMILNKNLQNTIKATYHKYKEVYVKSLVIDDEVEFFNERWVTARNLQSLVWYKKYLLSIHLNGIKFLDDYSWDVFFSDELVQNIETTTVNKEKKIKSLLFKKTKKIHDLRPELEKAYLSFFEKYRRKPTYHDLLEYIPLAFTKEFEIMNVRNPGGKVTEFTMLGRPMTKVNLKGRVDSMEKCLKIVYE